MHPLRTVRRAALAALALTCSSAADAQVVALFLEGEKSVKRYEDRVVRINGRPAVVGELRPNTGVTLEGSSFSRNPAASIELWVADPDDPAVPAYVLGRKGDLEPGSKKTVLRLDGGSVATKDYAMVLMRDETLPSLSREYTLRRAGIDELRRLRDGHDRASTDWAAAHARVITEMEGLQTWLGNTLWPKFAAEKYAKEIQKEAKAHKAAAVRVRHDRAMESLVTAEVPAAIAQAAMELTNGADRFHVRETLHLRMIFTDAIAPDSVEKALLLGEEVIEGFRTRFVDPYLGEDYADGIPDIVFQEFLVTPSDNARYMAYATALYGTSWNQNQEQRLQMGGERVDGSKTRAYRSYRKYDEQMDLEGIVCHQLGHALAGLHYGPGGNINQDWLSEALGSYLSFEFLARNTVTCKAFDSGRSGYVKRERQRSEGEKTVGAGRRALYNAIALELGRPIDQLARKDLYELDDADLAKSWSFFDYIARAEGKPGQLWLRAAGKYSHDAKTFIAEWRKAAAAVLGVGEAEAFRSVEARWRTFAETKGATGEKK